KYGIDTADRYVCFVNAQAPRVLVVGDSVSMAFYSAIHAGLVKEDAALVGAHSFNWRRPDCLKKDDLQAWMKGSENCQAVIRTALEILAREPSIEAVILPAFAGNPFFTDPAHLSQLQQAVLAHGKKVIYVTATPQFSRAPEGCWPRKLTLFGTD